MTPPDASDLDLILLVHRVRTRQWRVWEAVYKRSSVLAWEFDPDLAVDRARLAQTQLNAATHALTSDAPSPVGLRPQTSRFSALSNSGWVIFPAAPSAPPEVLANRDRWPELFGALLTGLDALHQRGVHHLDVHPDHLYERDGQLLLAGFGIDCRPALALSAPGNRNNTGLARPLFGAPEQWDASAESEIGPWTDVFGAAALMFRCVTGAPPRDFRQRRTDPDWRAEFSRELREPLAAFGEKAAALEIMILDGLEPAIAARPRSIPEWVGCPPEAFLSQIQGQQKVASTNGGRDAAVIEALGGNAPLQTNNIDQPAGSGSKLGGFIAGLTIAAALSAAAFGFTWVLANDGVFGSDSPAFTFFGLVVAVIAAVFALQLRSTRPSDSFVGVGGLVLSIPVALVCAAMAWETRLAPAPPAVPVPEMTPEPEPSEVPVDLSDLSADGVYRLEDGRWIDLRPFTGSYVGSTSENCRATGPFDRLRIEDAFKEKGLRIISPEGIIYQVRIVGGATRGAEVAQQMRTVDQGRDWLESLNKWDGRLNFEVVNVSRSDGGDVGKFPPDRMLLSRERGGALKWVSRYPESYGIEDVPGTFFPCV